MEPSYYNLPTYYGAADKSPEPYKPGYSAQPGFAGIQRYDSNPLSAGIQFGLIGAAGGLTLSAIQRAIHGKVGMGAPSEVLKPMLVGAIIGTAIGSVGSLKMRREPVQDEPKPSNMALPPLTVLPYKQSEHTMNRYVGLLRCTGMTKQAQYAELAPELARSAGYFVPYLGTGLLAQDAYRNFGSGIGNFRQGNWRAGLGDVAGGIGNTFLAGVSLVPYIGSAISGVAKGSKLIRAGKSIMQAGRAARTAAKGPNLLAKSNVLNAQHIPPRPPQGFINRANRFMQGAKYTAQDLARPVAARAQAVARTAGDVAYGGLSYGASKLSPQVLANLERYSATAAQRIRPYNVRRNRKLAWTASFGGPVAGAWYGAGEVGAGAAGAGAAGNADVTMNPEPERANAYPKMPAITTPSHGGAPYRVPYHYYGVT